MESKSSYDGLMPVNLLDGEQSGHISNYPTASFIPHGSGAGFLPKKNIHSAYVLCIIIFARGVGGRVRYPYIRRSCFAFFFLNLSHIGFKGFYNSVSQLQIFARCWRKELWKTK